MESPDTANRCISGERLPPRNTMRFLALALFLVTFAPMSTVRVPDVVGLSILQAKNRIAQAGLELGRVGTDRSSAPMGRVLRQDPPAGAVVARTAVVHLVVSARPHEENHE
jgi:beta-lactam-binding protein with PASTA domain